MNTFSSRLVFVSSCALAFVFLFGFSAQAGNITVTAPSANSPCLQAGSTYIITWTADFSLSHYAVYQTGDTTTPPSYGSWILNAHPVSGNSFSWSVPNTPGTPLKIWVEAHDASHASLGLWNSDLVGIGSSCGTSGSETMPAAPTNLNANTPSEGVVNLSWTDNATNESDYKLYRRTFGGTTWNLISTLSMNATNYTEPSVPVGTYEYQIWACNPTCSGSNIFMVNVIAPIVTATPTPTPTPTSDGGGSTNITDNTAPVMTNVRVENNIGMGAQIKWSTDDFSDSRVFYGTAPGALTLSVIGDCYGGSMYTSHCVNLMGLTSGTRYYYRAESRNASNLSISSSENSFVAGTSNTTVDTAPPTAPMLVASSISSSSITLAWSGATDDVAVAGYKIYRNGTHIGTTSILYYTDAGLSSGTTYSYYVIAYDAEGKYSPYGQSTSVTTYGTVVSDTGIAGSVVDSSGQAVVDVQGYISLFPSTSTTTTTTTSVYGAPIEKGSFSVASPAGTYTVKVYFPSDSAYTPPQDASVSISSGQMKSYTVIVGKSDAVITGFFRDSSGKIVTGLGYDKVNVFASSQGSAWHNAAINLIAGSYEIKASAGTWYLGYSVASSSGYTSQGSDIAITLSSGKTFVRDIILLRAGSTVSGIAVNEDGKPLANVWVSIDSQGISLNETPPAGTTTSFGYTGGTTDSWGAFTIAVLEGTYYVHAYYAQEFGYISPPEQKIVVLSGATSTITLVFKKPDTLLTGKTLILQKGSPAFVWAWGETGGYISTRSGADGSYAIAISKNNKWHVSASGESADMYYQSSGAIIDTKDATTISQDITLLSVQSVISAVERIVEATKSQTVELSDGAKVILPANSLSTSGSANFSVRPAADAPSIATSSVVGTSYSVEAKTETGQSISTLNSEITISIPYTDEDLAAKGLIPEMLVLSYFDEGNGAWKSVEKQVVDKKNKVVSATVSHLTIFALVAPADTTPPPSPTNMKISRAGNGTTLSWKNPSTDFHHIKIYKSSAVNTLGSVAYNYVTVEGETDTVSDSTTYYYTIRAVDLSGNESKNTIQLVASGASSSTSTAKRLFTKTLRIGSRGTEVTLLQESLKKDPSVYPSGLVTGYFGKLTKAAVVLFQKNNNISPIGIVGPKTRSKLNEIYGVK